MAIGPRKKRKLDEIITGSTGQVRLKHVINASKFMVFSPQCLIFFNSHFTVKAWAANPIVVYIMYRYFIALSF